MMLHDGEYELVVAMKHRAAKRRRHKVQRLGGAACEDYLLGRGGIEIPPHTLACSLLKLGGLLRECMHAPVYIGLGRRIVPHDGIHHLARSLRRSRIVEVDHRPSIKLPVKNREQRADIFNVHFYKSKSKNKKHNPITLNL